MKAIVTHRIGKIIMAETEGGKAWLPFDEQNGETQQHKDVAIKLCKQLGVTLGWEGNWIGGTLPDGESMVWVKDSRNSPELTVFRYC